MFADMLTRYFMPRGALHAIAAAAATLMMHADIAATLLAMPRRYMVMPLRDYAPATISLLLSGALLLYTPCCRCSGDAAMLTR